MLPLSLEFFPPKTAEGSDKLRAARRRHVCEAPGSESKALKTVADSRDSCRKSARTVPAFHLPLNAPAQYDGGSRGGMQSCR